MGSAAPGPAHPAGGDPPADLQARITAVLWQRLGDIGLVAAQFPPPESKFYTKLQNHFF